MASPTRVSPSYERALAYAKKAHEGQLRTSGEPFITHLIAVADFLKTLDADTETLVAALLHDTVEDTSVTYGDLKKEFGSVVADLVEGVTKVEQMEQMMDKRERNMLAVRKMFRTMGKDIRVIFIKLADRLHNMQTLKYVPIEKQIRIARETQDIYCPLANLLGVRTWYHQLADLCFEILDPTEYELIRKKEQQTRTHQLSLLKRWVERLETHLQKNGFPHAHVSLQKRHYRGVQSKTQGDLSLLQHVQTFYHVNVGIPNNKNPYEALGVVHTFATPQPNGMKDYIASPKINGYSALHTIVLSGTGVPLEVIVQTDDMQSNATLGMAALYRGTKKSYTLPGWVEALTALEKDAKDVHVFFQTIQKEIFGDHSHVRLAGRTKKEIDMPTRASVLDLAYYSGESAGAHVQHALVNKKKVSLKHPVTNGDVIELVLDKSKDHRSAQDLYFIHTSLGQKMLIAELMKLPRKDKIRRGRSLVNHAIEVAMDPFFSIQWQNMIRSRVHEYESAFENIGTGMVDPFLFIEEHSMPEDFFLLDPACFHLPSQQLPALNTRYILRTTLTELRAGTIVGLQEGPDVIEIISSERIHGSKDETLYSKELISLKVNSRLMMYPFRFALRWTYEPDVNPLEIIALLQSLLDTPVTLLQFENASVTLGFHTDRLRTAQIAYKVLYGLPSVSHIFRLTPR